MSSMKLTTSEISPYIHVYCAVSMIRHQTATATGRPTAEYSDKNIS